MEIKKQNGMEWNKKLGSYKVKHIQSSRKVVA
jgi:hypothetical protein